MAIAIPFADALSPEALGVQVRISSALAEIDGVARIESLVTSDDIYGENDSLVVRQLIPNGHEAEDLDAAALAHIRERVERNGLWTGFLVSKDRRTVSIQVHLDSIPGEPIEPGAIISQAEKIVRAELGDQPFHLAGHPVMKSEIAGTMTRDLALFLPVTLIVMAAFL